jgi:hypothetical protein
MLTPHRYLTRTKGKNSRIIPQPWTINLAQSTILNVMKIPHFGRHEEVNRCIKLLLSCYHGSYLWLDRHIIVDLTLIHRITGLSMQGPDPQGKAADRALAQRIKDTYGDVEKGTWGYKVASIQNDIVHLACQLIAGNLVRKNRPTHVMRFVVDLIKKCVEGLQMNWVKYLANQLLDFCEAQDQGYEFHFSWLLILIAFTAWEMPEGATFPDIEPFKPLPGNFSTLWYSSNMGKQWQLNTVFHTYYLQLKRVIGAVPHMTQNTLHRFKPLMKSHADQHFIYITVHADKNKEQIQSYYNLTEEDLEEITKDWSTELLIPTDPTEMSDPKLIGSSKATHEEHDTPVTSMRKNI